MTLEDMVQQHKEISLKIEELEAQKKTLGESILQAMSSKTMQVGSYIVKRCSRLSIQSTIDQARHFQAVKVEEVVDKDKLKALYREGVTIPGIKQIEYIQVSISENLVL